MVKLFPVEDLIPELPGDKHDKYHDNHPESNENLVRYSLRAVEGNSVTSTACVFSWHSRFFLLMPRERKK